MASHKDSKKLIEEVRDVLARSMRLRKESEAIQEEHRRVLKRLIDTDEDLARLFKRLGIENKHILMQ